MHYIQKKIGIVGGGQLAQMMVMVAQKRGQEVHVLSQNEQDPAAKVCPNWIEGNPSSKTALEKLSRRVDIMTFESEFLSSDSLHYLSESDFKVFPSPKMMDIIADRMTQKQLLLDNNVPTSPFDVVEDIDDLLELKTKRNLPIVLKSRRNGYDGYGTYILKSWKDSRVSNFVESCEFGLIAEDFIPFKRELAVSVAVNENKEIVFLPLVETFQENYKCLWVKGPIEHPKFTSLKKKLVKMMKNVNYVGIISFEIFDTGKELIINEIAPRVHNSAHYSQDGLSICQFDLHLRSITGAPLERPRALSKGFAMMNLIGSKKIAPKLSLPAGVNLHWYAKAENRPGRKMGHLNATASDPNRALSKVKTARESFNL